MSDYKENFQLQMETLFLWKCLEKKCEEKGDKKVPKLIWEVGEYAVAKLKTVLNNMKEFTLHDDVHIFNMLHIIEKLLSKELIENLSIPDLMLIFLSVFLHDIGMCPMQNSIRAWKGEINTEEEQYFEYHAEYLKFRGFRKTYVDYLLEIKELEKIHDYATINLIEEYIITDYIRSTHSFRAKEYIAKDWKGKIQYQDTDLSVDLANICFSHNEDYKFILGLDHIKVCGFDVYTCIPFVAVLLRLADIIDFDPKRAPKILFSHLSIRNSVSLQEWKKHLSISAWTFTPRSILYSAQCEHPATEQAIRNFCDLIDTELKNATHIISNLHSGELDYVLQKYKKVQFPIQVNRNYIQAKKDIITGRPVYQYHETAFNLNKNQVIDLLMGTKLYRSPDVALRELIQNSIDACMLRTRVTEAYNIHYTPDILIYLYNQEGCDYLTVLDNGMGMNQSIIDKYYTNIGCSYYKSNDFYDMTAKLNISFSPISKFGIGILACFMVCDEMKVETRRVVDQFNYDNPISIQIEGYDSLFVIKDGQKKEPGTETTLKLRKDHPWANMNKDEFIDCVRTTLRNPPFPVHINFRDESIYEYTQDNIKQENEILKMKKRWIVAPNIKKVDFSFNVPEFGFKGRASIAYIVESNKPVEEIKLHAHNVIIDNKEYALSSNYTYDEFGIFKCSDTIELTDDNKVNISSNTSTTMPSYAEVSLRGITIPCNLFSDFNNPNQEAVINFPLPTLLVLDIYDKTELNLNTARTNVIYDNKWLEFEKKLVLTLCTKMRMKLKAREWKYLQKIIINKLTNPDLKQVVADMKIS